MTIPSTVQIIGNNVFKNCNYLNTVDFQENSELRSLGDEIFNSSSIQKFTIPSLVDDIKEKTFIGAKKLIQFVILPENKHYSMNNCFLLYRKNEDEDFNVLIFVCKNVKEVILPRSITDIKPYAFNGCTNLSYFEIEKGSKLTFIHKNNFVGLNLKTIVVPFSLSNVRSYVQNYDKITEIVITDDEIKIEKSSFLGLQDLVSVSFPFAKKISFEKGSQNLSYFRPLSSQLFNEEPSLEQKIRKVSDDFIVKNRFPSEKEELQYFQAKEINK